jgi:hypothetical protein
LPPRGEEEEEDKMMRKKASAPSYIKNTRPPTTHPQKAFVFRQSKRENKQKKAHAWPRQRRAVRAAAPFPLVAAALQVPPPPTFSKIRSL